MAEPRYSRGTTRIDCCAWERFDGLSVLKSGHVLSGKSTHWLQA